jgi:hypothetical protein
MGDEFLMYGRERLEEPVRTKTTFPVQSDELEGFIAAVTVVRGKCDYRAWNQSQAIQ